MSIILLGAVTSDKLVFPKKNWQTKTSLGGLIYTINALTYLTNESIIPICNVGYDKYNDVIRFLSQFDNVSTEGITKVNHLNIQCNIIYVNEYGIQYDIGEETPIKFSQLSSYLRNCKFILASSMTGYDLKLSMFKKLKRDYNIPTYFDYHILALGRDKLGNRYLRRKKNWMDWCINCDHLQMNKFEAEQLSGISITNKKAMLRFAHPIMKNGVKTLTITLGKKGAYVCINENSKTKFINLEPISVNEIDATGCGDTFAAAFVAIYLKSNKIRYSLECANKIAGLKSSFHGFDQMERIINNIK
jgi:sugar/nucleoside kinase (ribokinase family)